MACTQCGLTRSCICPKATGHTSTLDLLDAEYQDLRRREQKGEGTPSSRARMQEIESVMNTHQ